MKTNKEQMDKVRAAVVVKYLQEMQVRLTSVLDSVLLYQQSRDEFWVKIGGGRHPWMLIDDDIVEDMIRIQLSRNAHAIDKANEAL